MKVLLIRHGETATREQRDREQANPPDDTKLNVVGKAQAQIAAQICDREKVVKIYSSPAVRAQQTAQIIAGERPIEIIASLRERNLGEWGTREWGAVREQLETMTLEERFTFMPPGGESWQDMQKRALKAIRKIVDAKESCLAIVSHQGLLRSLLPALLKQPRETATKLNFFHGGVTALNYDGQDWELVYLNRTEV